MAERYYNLEMGGNVIKTTLSQVANKLNVEGGTATNLKVVINSDTPDPKYAANQEYVNSAISRYVELNNGNLKVGNNNIDFNTYLQKTGDKKLKLADDNQVDFGTAGQVLTSTGENEAPVWVNAKVITIEEVTDDDSDEDNLNGITSIAVDGADDHKLIITKDSFIRTADLDDDESAIGSALAAKVDLSTLCGETAVLVSKPEYVLQVGTDKENQVLKTIKDENELKIVWEDEKVFALNVVEDDSSSSMPEDATEVVSSLRYDEPNLYVYNERTVNYEAYKAFEASVANSLGQKATKAELEGYATKEVLGDQFTMEFDSSTKTLTIIKK